MNNNYQENEVVELELVDAKKLVDKEKRREYLKKYYRNNQDKRKQYQKEYRLKNKEKCKEYGKEYQQKNKETLNEYQKEYQQKKRDGNRLNKILKEYGINPIQIV